MSFLSSYPGSQGKKCRQTYDALEVDWEFYLHEGEFAERSMYGHGTITTTGSSSSTTTQRTSSTPSNQNPQSQSRSR